jgi:hypothetical protein
MFDPAHAPLMFILTVNCTAVMLPVNVAFERFIVTVSLFAVYAPVAAVLPSNVPNAFVGFVTPLVAVIASTVSVWTSAAAIGIASTTRSVMQSDQQARILQLLDIGDSTTFATIAPSCTVSSSLQLIVHVHRATTGFVTLQH